MTVPQAAELGPIMAYTTRMSFRSTKQVILDLLVCCSLTASAADSNIVAHWPFEGDRADTAALLPAEGLPTSVAGKLGRALRFSGKNHAEVPDAPSLRLESGLTLELWAKADEVVRRRCGGLALKLQSFGIEWVHQDLKSIRGLHNKVRAYLWLRDGNSCVLSTPSAVSTGEWHHFALTYDSGSGEGKFFVDGRCVGKRLLSGELLRTSAQPLCIGAIQPGLSRFHGAIDEVTILDRALTDDEIQSRYAMVAAGRRPPTPEFRPVQHGPSLFPLSNNRQIVRSSSGQWSVVFGERGTLMMATPTVRPREDTRPLDGAFALCGKGGFSLADESFSAAAALVDAKDTLHVVAGGTKGFYCGRCSVSDDAQDKVKEASAWDWTDAGMPFAPGTDIHLSDIAMDSAGRLWVAYCRRRAVEVGVMEKGKWAAHRVAASGSEPVLDIDAQDHLHLAFTHDRRICYAHSDDGVVWRGTEGDEPDVAARSMSTRPSMVAVDGRPLIAFQFKGAKRVKWDSPGYTLEREGAGASIGFAYHDGDRWVRGYVARSREFVITRLSVMGLAGLFGSTSGGTSRPMLEYLWRPQLAIDKHGVPWVFWPDTARRHTYYARWQGSCFSSRYECRLCPGFLSRQVSVEKAMPRSADCIGMLSAARGQILMDQVRVPSLSASVDRRVPLIDLLDVSAMADLEHHLSQAEKRAGNPIMRSDPKGWDNLAMALYGTVLYEKGQFRMWYLGKGSKVRGYPCGYATSGDGIHWERPNLGLVDVAGSKANNLVFPSSYSSYVYRDDAAPHPEKRYKVAYRTGGWHTYSFNFSPDGIHWPKQDPKYRNVTAEMEVHSFYRDPYDVPARRWKIVGQGMSPAGRTVAMQWSPDLIHWQGRAKVTNPTAPDAAASEVIYGKAILDPVGGDEGQIYMGSAWVENGMTLCLYEPMMPDGPYDLALAVSRDGIHFSRINPTERVISAGAAGEWDSGIIAFSTAPVRVGDEIRLYYDGSTGHHGLRSSREDKRSIGLATLPRGRWAYVSPDPKSGRGVLTTIPIDLSGAKDTRLTVNVSGLSADPPSAHIRVAVIDPLTNRAVPGFTTADCESIVTNGLDVPVSWAKGRAMAEAGLDVAKLRFHVLGGSARLYAFAFRR